MPDESLQLEHQIIDYLRQKRGQAVSLCHTVGVISDRLGGGRANRKRVFSALNKVIKQRQVVKSKDAKTVRISELVA